MYIHTYIHYITLHYITVHYITLHCIACMHIHIHIHICISIVVCLLTYVCISFAILLHCWQVRKLSISVVFDTLICVAFRVHVKCLSEQIMVCYIRILHGVFATSDNDSNHVFFCLLHIPTIILPCRIQDLTALVWLRRFPISGSIRASGLQLRSPKHQAHRKVLRKLMIIITATGTTTSWKKAHRESTLKGWLHLSSAASNSEDMLQGWQALCCFAFSWEMRVMLAWQESHT